MKRSIYLKTSKPHLRRSAGRAKQSGPYRVVKSRRGTPDCEPRVPPSFSAVSAHTSSRGSHVVSLSLNDVFRPAMGVVKLPDRVQC